MLSSTTGEKTVKDRETRSHNVNTRLVCMTQHHANLRCVCGKLDKGPYLRYRRSTRHTKTTWEVTNTHG
jgi:hypothetical protein